MGRESEEEGNPGSRGGKTDEGKGSQPDTEEAAKLGPTEWKKANSPEAKCR